MSGPNSVMAVMALGFNGLRPSQVKGNDIIGTSRVETNISAFQRHWHDTSLLARHKDLNSLLTFNSVHIALILDMGHSLLSQVVGNQG